MNSDCQREMDFSHMMGAGRMWMELRIYSGMPSGNAVPEIKFNQRRTTPSIHGLRYLRNEGLGQSTRVENPEKLGAS